MVLVRWQCTLAVHWEKDRKRERETADRQTDRQRERERERERERLDTELSRRQAF